MIRVFASDEDDSVGACRVSLDVLEGGGDVCSTIDPMTGCDGIRSVAVVGGGADVDRCTFWRRCGSGVRERPLNLTHFACRILQQCGMSQKDYSGVVEMREG